jgi:type VI secretion system protein ImpE
MTAEELLHAGKPDEALLALQQQVRAHPGDAARRVFLFQLLAVLGQWERANTQLGVCGELDPSAASMVQSYREALRCEALRDEVFAGRRSPLIFGEPTPWIGLMLESLRCCAAGDFAAASRAQRQGLDAAPATPGRIDDGAAFEWIGDADARLGPVLEAIINGRYYWVPFERLLALEIEAPSDLRDTVWLPVKLQFANGGETVGFVPSRYPGTTASSDGALKLARRTDWTQPVPDFHVGLGQRMLATDISDHALFEIRRIQFEPAAVASGAVSGAVSDTRSEAGGENG